MLGEGDEVGVSSAGWHLLALGIQRVNNSGPCLPGAYRPSGRRDFKQIKLARCCHEVQGFMRVYCGGRSLFLCRGKDPV